MLHDIDDNHVHTQWVNAYIVQSPMYCTRVCTHATQICIHRYVIYTQACIHRHIRTHTSIHSVWLCLTMHSSIYSFSIQTGCSAIWTFSIQFIEASQYSLHSKPLSIGHSCLSKDVLILVSEISPLLMHCSKHGLVF